jgi:hypothetical protein
MFDVVFSKRLTATKVSRSLLRLIPKGRRVDVVESMDGLPDNPGSVWGLINKTNDSSWPCAFDCLACSPDIGLGEYPDLRIAEHMSHTCAVDCLCFSTDFLFELDPQDPYWALALIDGQWHLVSTCGMALMGPYSDGVSDIQGDSQIQIIRPVDVPTNIDA